MDKEPLTFSLPAGLTDDTLVAIAQMLVDLSEAFDLQYHEEIARHYARIADHDERQQELFGEDEPYPSHADF